MDLSMKLEIVITMRTHRLILNAQATEERSGRCKGGGGNAASVLVCFGELAVRSEIKRDAVLSTLHLSKKKGAT